jgi:ATP-dependent RNA helicase DDX21
MAKAEKEKKEKKEKKAKAEVADAAPKKSSKRKPDEAADTIDDHPKEKKSKNIKDLAAVTPAPPSELHAEAVTDDKSKVDPALMLDNFGLSDTVKGLLRGQGINSLFPIQAQTLPHGLAGLDVVGRARTGCGKTLGFSLPLIERLMRDQAEGLNVGKGLGRTPSAIIMAPTRELAKQIHDVLAQIGKACTGLIVLTVYGGTPYESQETALRKGVDVVVGTPGRIKDLMQRGRLKLDAIRYRILDEVDRMMVSDP